MPPHASALQLGNGEEWLYEARFFGLEERTPYRGVLPEIQE